jgi:hypothetical protein
MIMTTKDPALDADEVPTLPDGLLEQALAGPSDPRRNEALLALFQRMLPYAIMLIRAAFDDTKPRRKTAPTTSQIRELVSAQHVPLPDDDPGEEDPAVRAEITKRTQESIIRATEAALASAVESFHTHGKKEFASAHSLEELAVNLVRITYNRYQSRRRDDTRLARQTKSGSGANAEGSFPESWPDKRANPAAEAELRDFLEIQRRLVDGALEGFSTRDRQIILLYEAGYEPDAILDLINRLGHKRKPCTLNTVHHVIDTFKVQLARLEEGDDDDQPCDNEDRPA